MPSRELPPRPHLEHLRNEAITAFLHAVAAGDRVRALDVLGAAPGLETSSIHVASVLGRDDEVRRLLAADRSLVRRVAGRPPSEPLLWLCYSPFHGESASRDEGLERSARALLDAGADPNTRDPEHGLPALFAVTGHNDAPRIARLLLDAGADPNDGESVFHAAERFHEEALELLLSRGVDLNRTGEWGNTPLWFLLNHHHVEDAERVRLGLGWLLDHGADPNVPSGREREGALHAAVRRGQRPAIVKLLIEHGADVRARRADGRTPWMLAGRGGFDALKEMLEGAGAEPEPLTPEDLLLAACSRGDEHAARRLGTPELIASLDPAAMLIMHGAARNGSLAVVQACLAAGFPIGTTDEIGSTALHQASIAGRADVVRYLLAKGANAGVRDDQHRANALEWACFGADHHMGQDSDHARCARALLEAGATLTYREQLPDHPDVRAVLQEFGIR